MEQKLAAARGHLGKSLWCDVGFWGGLVNGNAAQIEPLFIVRATGKSAAERLELLQTRLPGDAAAEWRIAAAEQRKITRLRLEKLLSP